MNYFFKKRHFRLLSLVLAICIAAAMFAGCQKAKPEESTPPTDESLPAGLVEVKPSEATEPPTEATEPANENMATVTDQLNVRSSPSTGAKIIGYLDPGTQVEIIKTETYMGVEWALIREGWIVLDYVEMNNGSDAKDPDDDTNAPTEPAPTEPANTTKITGKVTSNGLNIRKEPNTTSTIVGNYTNGTTITILETKNGWGRTDKGWVSMTYVNTTGNTANNNNTTNNNNTNTTNNNTTTTTTDGATYYITATTLNIRDQAGTNGRQVGSYVEGDKVVILETSNGWGRTDKGWISMQYAYKNGATGANTAKGIVTGNGLNIRSGPGTNYGSVGNYASGTRVNILEQITVNGTTWGCTDKGWISLGYVYVDGTRTDESSYGTVTGDKVNIRSGPGTGYASVGSLSAGDEVEILAQFEFNGTYWGCTSKGWVCMDYVGVG